MRLKELAAQVSLIINEVGRKNYQPRSASRAVRGATTSSLLVRSLVGQVGWRDNSVLNDQPIFFYLGVAKTVPFVLVSV